MKKHYDRIFASINLDAISYNMDNIANLISSNTKILSVVKTDGYGHGAVPIALELEPKEYMYGFATATAEEAFVLRKAGIKKPILVLGYVFPYTYYEMIRNDIRLTVFREDMIGQIESEARKLDKKAKVHIKVDTGMGRIGISPDESGFDFIQKLLNSEWLEIEGIFTHFAKADYEDKTDANMQYQIFSDFCNAVEDKFNMKIPLKHCANSAAALEMPNTHMDMVRIGISTYGLWPSEEVNKDCCDLKPAFSLHSHIVYLKTLDAGKEISYGGTFVTPKLTKIATIPAGYGDGYPRTLSNIGYVLIHGKKAPILGRICMDQFMVDVTDIDVNVGDKVILMGSDGNISVTADEIASLTGTINYEVVCDISKRVPREVVK